MASWFLQVPLIWKLFLMTIAVGPPSANSLSLALRLGSVNSKRVTWWGRIHRPGGIGFVLIF